VKLAEYRKTLTGPLKQATLCFLIREGGVLLAMKKRGFGKGRWNGLGGKPEQNETIKKAAIRETQEEIGVTPVSLRKVAKLDFYTPNNPEWNQQVIVFLVDKWKGEPKESEEMAPQWFKMEDIPFDSMWACDSHWLPKVLEGKTLTAEFMFDENDEILEMAIHEGEQNLINQT